MAAYVADLREMALGALHGRTIKLIGDTDPRGTAKYNERLGLQPSEVGESLEWATLPGPE